MRYPSLKRTLAAELDPSRLRRAAQYVRMSTEHQQYSIANQSAAIALYAAANNLGVVRAFEDGAKSGVTIKGRKGLQELLRIVESGTADFEHILVYDVSRWGRFPDSDEAAHYEFLCKRAGVRVRYCAEQFENDNSTTSNLLKALKRTMASEYSRELSVKVSAGQRRLAGLGFWQGGTPPFAMERQHIDPTGKRRVSPKTGEWKGISTDRAVLVPGPPEAVRTVRRAFNLYTKQGKTRQEIAEILNRGTCFRGSSKWTNTTVRLLLSAPIYKGAYAYAKRDFRRDGCKLLPRDEWIVRENTFPAMVCEKQWNQAQARIWTEIKPWETDEMLEHLRRLWKRKGRLSSKLINEDKTVPSAVAYFHRFGSLNAAYGLIGYPLPKDYSYLHSINMSRDLRSSVCEEICRGVRSVHGTAELLPEAGTILLNGNIRVQVFLRKAWSAPGLRPRWNLLLGKTFAADVLIVGRLKPPSGTILDYFVVPAISKLRGALTARERENDGFLEVYRCDTLQAFIQAFRCDTL